MLKLEEHEARPLSTLSRKQERKTTRCCHDAFSLRWHKDLKGVMREKAKHGERTFALTADVSEAQSQIPVTQGLAPAGLPSPSKWLGLYQQSRDLRRRFSVLLLVESLILPSDDSPSISPVSHDVATSRPADPRIAAR